MQPDDIWVSTVVNTVDDHLYKADLLIRTLDRHASIPPCQVIVHYVNRLPRAPVATFSRRGCKTRKIEPFLDGKYCNRLQQLSFVDEFGLSEPAGLLLLDVDIAVTAPLVIPDRDRIAGKIVDAPHLPIHVLTRIFEAAAVALRNRSNAIAISGRPLPRISTAVSSTSLPVMQMRSESLGNTLGHSCLKTLASSRTTSNCGISTRSRSPWPSALRGRHILTFPQTATFLLTRTPCREPSMLAAASRCYTIIGNSTISDF